MSAPKPGVVADVHRKCIVITITDEGEAYDIASAYGRSDLFYDEVMQAATQVWATTGRSGLAYGAWSEPMTDVVA